MPYAEKAQKLAAQKRYSMTPAGKAARHRYYLSIKAKRAAAGLSPAPRGWEKTRSLAPGEVIQWPTRRKT